MMPYLSSKHHLLQSQISVTQSHKWVKQIYIYFINYWWASTVSEGNSLTLRNIVQAFFCCDP